MTRTEHKIKRGYNKNAINNKNFKIETRIIRTNNLRRLKIYHRIWKWTHTMRMLLRKNYFKKNECTYM